MFAMDQTRGTEVVCNAVLRFYPVITVYLVKTAKKYRRDKPLLTNFSALVMLIWSEQKVQNQ